MTRKNKLPHIYIEFDFDTIDYSYDIIGNFEGKFALIKKRGSSNDYSSGKLSGTENQVGFSLKYGRGKREIIDYVNVEKLILRIN